MRHQASLTAEYMALFRALESLRSARSRLFADPYAAIFLRTWRRWLYDLARVNAGRWVVESLLDRESPGARAAGIARTKWIDDEAVQILETVRQLVLLGAGYDTRAYRLPHAAGLTVFELDHPETSLAKQEILRNKLATPPTHVRFVGIDFNQHPLSEALHQAGFDQAQPACLIWEGVSNYLTPAAVDRLLRQIGQFAVGSVLLFTYIHRGVLEQPEQFFGAKKLLSRLDSYGEPWTFGLYPQELEAYLAARGLRLLTDLSAAEVWQRSGRPISETRGYDFYRLASASVQR